MSQIINDRWKAVDEILRLYKKKYKKTQGKTKKEIQNLFDSLNIKYEDLSKPISSKNKMLLNNAIAEAKQKKFYTGYFKFKIEEIEKKKSVNYRDYISIMVYITYMNELDTNYNDIESVMTTSAYSVFNQGRSDLRLPKIKKIPPIWYELLPALYVQNVAFPEYLMAFYLTCSQELEQQVLASIQNQKELDVTSEIYQVIFARQSNKLININDEKNTISGGLDKYVVAFSNERYMEASDILEKNSIVGAMSTDEEIPVGSEEENEENEEKKVKVRFISAGDSKVTKMCKSLDDQIFYKNDWNEFDRYSAETGQVEHYKIYGLQVGINLPPIIDHFHWCRSTITYQIDNLELQREIRNNLGEAEEKQNGLRISKKINGVGLAVEYRDRYGVMHPILHKEKIAKIPESGEEFEMAQWIKKNLGGEITIVPRIDAEKGSKTKVAVRTPDYMWNSERWDLKGIDGNSANTIEHIFQSAVNQTDNLILFARNTQMSDIEIKKYISEQMKIYDYKKVIYMRDKKLVKEYYK